MSKKDVYKIMIDNKPYDFPSQYLTLEDIKRIGSIKEEYGVWMKIHGPGDDPEITKDEKIDLSEPGRDKFFSGPKKITDGRY